MTKKNIENILVTLCKAVVVVTAIAIGYAFVCGVMCL